MFSLSTKLAVILLIFLAAFGYASWWNNKTATIDEDFLILKHSPSFSVDDIYSKNKITNTTLFNSDGKNVYIHFWATWCAPCEKELPEFLDFARKIENRSSKFVLVAVNDDIKKVKKFLNSISKKFSSNIIFGLDSTGVGRNDFGTVKVPETYLFDSKGIAVRKFIGVQSW